MVLSLPLLIALVTPPDVSLGDLAWFPPLAVVREQRQISYTIWLATRNVNRRHEAWDFRWMDADAFQQLYQAAQYSDDCWWKLAQARQNNDVYDLEGLRNLLGYDDYYSGTMPPAAPFKELR